MDNPHKAIAINQNIAAFVPKSDMVDGKPVPIIYANQEAAQAAADEFAIEMEAKTGIPGWNGFIEGVYVPQDTPPPPRI